MNRHTSDRYIGDDTRGGLIGMKTLLIVLIISIVAGPIGAQRIGQRVRVDTSTVYDWDGCREGCKELTLSVGHGR